MACSRIQWQTSTLCVSSTSFSPFSGFHIPLMEAFRQVDRDVPAHDVPMHPTSRCQAAQLQWLNPIYMTKEFQPLEPSESSRMPLPVYNEVSLDYSSQNDHLLLPTGNDVRYSGIFCPVGQGTAILARDLSRSAWCCINLIYYLPDMHGRGDQMFAGDCGTSDLWDFRHMFLFTTPAYIITHV